MPRWPQVSWEERFWGKVERRGPEECWPWQAGTDRDGYGHFGVPAEVLGRDHASVMQAHRVAFFLIHGRWPEPHALHGCDSPPCCNAMSLDHVHEGTHRQNMREMVTRGRFVQNSVPGLARRPLRRFTDEQVILFRHRNRDGESVVSLADEAGVRDSAMWRLLRGRTYADVRESDR